MSRLAACLKLLRPHQWVKSGFVFVGLLFGQWAKARGYKVIGTAPATLVYVTDRFYDPADEGRIPYNDPSIQYDWELQHK